MRSKLEQKVWVAVAVVAAVVLVAEVVAWNHLFVHRSNVLARNPGWEVMKEEVIYHPSAWEEFIRTPLQADGVDLWRGQGYQGIRWARHDGVQVERLAVTAELRMPGSYLYVLFRVGPEGAYALRLSTHPQHPSGFFVLQPDWQAKSFEPLAEGFTPPVGRDMGIEIRLDGPEARAFLDGEEIGRFRDERLSGGTVALKGGFLPVRIEQVEIEGRDRGGGAVDWSDDFRHGSTEGAGALVTLAGASLLVLFGCLVVLVRRNRELDRVRLAGLVLPMVIGSGLFMALQWWSSTTYAGLGSLVVLLLGGSLLVAHVIRVPTRPRSWASAASAVALLLLGTFLAAVVLRAGSEAPVPWGRGPEREPPPVQGSSRIVDASVGRPSVLGDGSRLGDQTLRLRATLEESSLLEIRFWAPDLDSQGPEYQCSGRWHGLLLSTVPEVSSGFYRYSAEIDPLGLIQDDRAVVPGRPIDLKVVVRGDTLAAYDGEALLARARVPAPEGGRTGLYVFAGDAEVRAVELEGRPAAATGPGGVHDAWLWPVALAFLAAGAVILGRRWPLRAALGAAVLSLVPVLGLLAVEAQLSGNFPVAGRETRIWVAAALWSQAAVLLALLPRPRRGLRWWRPAAASALAGAALVVAVFGDWSDPYRVVQLEMQASVPATPYRWLWYRHPSFRACNGFVQDQRFGEDRVPAGTPAGATRVVTLGASQTLGFGASDLEHAFPSQLERALDADGDRFEVLNAGVPGSYTLTSRSYFEGVLAEYSPDVVVVNYCAADYIYLSLLSLYGLEPDRMLAQIERTGHRPSGVERLLDNMNFWYGFRQSQKGVPPDHEWVRSTYRQNLRSLVRSASRTGARVFILLEPKSSEVAHPRIDYPALYDEARKVAELEGAEVIDPSRAVRWAEQSGVVWWDYAHMTDFGYRVLAGEVARAILQGIPDEVAG